MDIKLREATLHDMASIFQLYAYAYEGTYPDPTFSEVSRLKNAIETKSKFIFIAEEEGKLIGSILFLYQDNSKLGKAGAAVVLPEYRGQQITQKLIKFGSDFIEQTTTGLDVLYVTTRTVHKAAQILTQKIGFRQLGIFPNVHKTKDYETHALAAIFHNNSLVKRYTDFKHHPSVLPLYNIVRENIELPEMELTHDWDKKVYGGKVPTLEIIKAKEFVKRRYLNLCETKEIDLAFFPFHTPNYLITSPNQKIEVFLYVNELDKHSVITGCKIDREVSFTDLFIAVGHILRDKGIRYVESIIRANRLNIIDKIYKARFIPCGYVPAFQQEGDLRYDYVVFSRSFEVLDFKNLELTGENEKYLKNYISLWEEQYLGGHFKK